MEILLEVISFIAIFGSVVFVILKIFQNNGFNLPGPIGSAFSGFTAGEAGPDGAPGETAPDNASVLSTPPDRFYRLRPTRLKTIA